MSATFDTLKLADRLQSAGFTSDQARGTASARSEALVGDLVTKGSLNETRLALKADIAEVRAELKADIAELKAELKADIAELKADIAEVKAELRIFRWMMGFLLAFQVAIFIKLFVH